MAGYAWQIRKKRPSIWFRGWYDTGAGPASPDTGDLGVWMTHNFWQGAPKVHFLGVNWWQAGTTAEPSGTILALDRSFHRRVFGRVFGRVN